MLKDSLTASGLCLLLGLGSGAGTAGQVVMRAVRRLHSVLILPPAMPIQIIHPSSADFLTEPTRCIDLRFHIPPALQQRLLTIRCLETMEKFLTINICNINPSLLNSEVQDLQARIATNIPESLQYACQFWADHLENVELDIEIFGQVKVFFYRHLLQWLEVLSLLDFIGHTFRCLCKAAEWISVSDFIR
jgi:hypothetical protein